MTEPGAAEGETDIQAQAAVWFARMRSDERTHADEAGFHDWISEDPRRRAAFEEITANWDAVGAIGRSPELRRPAPAVARPLQRREFMLAAASVAAVAVVGAGWWTLTGRTDVYRTAVGETRQVSLKDGSRVLLDTDTLLTVRFSGDRRSLELKNGRAHFAVAKDTSRPFVVAAGERQVVAVGTAFDVSHFGAAASVLLLEGKIAVQRRSAAGLETVAELGSPGVRLSFDANGQVQQDRPDVSRLTAWQTRKLVFEDDRLQDAVAELNRYNPRPVVLAGARFADARVSGIYSADDPLAFATSVAVLLNGKVREEQERIVVSD